MSNETFAATVAAADLHAALKIVNKVIEARNSIPILANVLLRLRAGGVDLVATDLDIEARLTVAGDVPADLVGAALTVDAWALLAAVSKADKGAVIRLSITPTNGEKLLFETGRTRLHFATLPADEFPRLCGLDDGHPDGLTMPAAQLAHDLARLSPAMSSEETRYYLNGVHIGIDDNGLFTMTATDGDSVATIARGIVAPAGWQSGIIPRKAVGHLIRQLGKKPVGDVALWFDGTRYAAAYGAATVTAKAIDGTFPDVAKAIAAAIGEGDLQRVAFPDDEPRLKAERLASLGKAAGAPFIVEMGENIARLTVASAPEYVGWTMLFREGRGARKGFSYERNEGADYYATRYLVDLAAARGFDVARFFAVPLSNADRSYHPLRLNDGCADGERFAMRHGKQADIIGATFGGVLARAKSEPVEIVDWETLTTRIEYVSSPDQYEDGAFSVAMPRERRFMSAVVTVGEGDGERPIRTNAKGEIELTAAQVRAMAANGEPTPRVEIAPLCAFMGARLPEGWRLPVPVTAKARAAARSVPQFGATLTDADYPFWVGEGGPGSRLWRAEVAAGVLATDDGEWSWLDRHVAAGRDAVANQVEAEPVAEAPRAFVVPDILRVSHIAPRMAAEDGAGESVAETDELRHAPASPADGGDMAATVAALVARIEALEAAARKPTGPTPIAVYAAPGDPKRDAWEATLAARAGVDLPAPVVVTPDWEQIAHERAAMLDAESARADETEAALASMTAERDALQAESAYLHAARDRTATIIRRLRRKSDLDIRALKAGRVWAVEQQARAERAEADAARLRVANPFAAIRYSGGHVGARVTLNRAA